MRSMTTTRKLIIFTDLDGTLLDRNTYAFEQATPALLFIQQKNIPLVFSSSKTRAEIEFYRRKLENDHPFISENGGAVFVPRYYFSFPFSHDRESGEYLVLEFGAFHPHIRETLEAIKKETGIKIRGFSDLTEKEIASLCGLSMIEAGYAKKREYDEPFMVEGGDKEVEKVREKIEEMGLSYVWGGKFHHILGKNDKGKAVEILKEFYEKQFLSILTVGIGDSLNDLPMLSVVDLPVFLKGKDNVSEEVLSAIQNITMVDDTGPQAWNELILNMLHKLGI